MLNNGVLISKEHCPITALQGTRSMKVYFEKIFGVWLLSEKLCISQASPQKQNQQNVLIQNEIYFKELNHTIMEAWQVQNLIG